MSTQPDLEQRNPKIARRGKCAVSGLAESTWSSKGVWVCKEGNWREGGGVKGGLGTLPAECHMKLRYAAMWFWICIVSCHVTMKVTSAPLESPVLRPRVLASTHPRSFLHSPRLGP